MGFEKHNIYSFFKPNQKACYRFPVSILMVSANEICGYYNTSNLQKTVGTEHFLSPCTAWSLFNVYPQYAKLEWYATQTCSLKYFILQIQQKQNQNKVDFFFILLIYIISQ